MGGTTWAVAFCEAGHRIVVQQFYPLDRLVYTIAVADGEKGEAFVFFVPGGYLLPCLFLESLQFLMEVVAGEARAITHTSKRMHKSNSVRPKA